MADDLNAVDTNDAADAESADSVDTGTIADGNDGGDKPQEIPATWPDDWREKLSSDPDDLKTLKRWKDPANLWKQNKELRAKLSSGEFRRAMPETDDENVIKEWRAEVGIPEDHWEYIGEDLEVSEEDRPMVDEYLSKMHQVGADKKSVQDGLKWYFEARENALEQQVEQDKTFRQESEDALRAEWGPEYRANLNNMHSLFDTFDAGELKERLFTARFDDGRLFGDDPDMLKFLVDVSREINPSHTLTPSPGQTPSQTVEKRITELETEMRDTKGREPGGYWNSPEKQAELRDLYNAQEKLRSRGAS